jgi:hypothetical protein
MEVDVKTWKLKVEASPAVAGVALPPVLAEDDVTLSKPNRRIYISNNFVAAVRYYAAITSVAKSCLMAQKFSPVFMSTFIFILLQSSVDS